MGVSRRQADKFVEDKRVLVNDVLPELGSPVNEGDMVKVDGEEVSISDYTYLVFHKPTGYVCSRNRQGDNPTIYELLPDKYQKLKIAGRLDKDSSGLVLFTDDGNFADQMMHPRYEKSKQYEVELDHSLSAQDMKNIREGIELDDGVSRLEISNEGTSFTVIMREGRNRQIRRTFSSLRYEVEKLHRTKLGPLELGDLGPKQYNLIPKPS